MELILAVVVVIMISALLVVLLAFYGKIDDIRDTVLMSEDQINRLAEKFDGVDDVQYEIRRDDRQRGRWN